MDFSAQVSGAAAAGFSQPRFYGILDTGYVAPQDMVPKCRALLSGGAQIVQLRAKKQTRDEMRMILCQILPLFMKSGVPLIVNDDIELALEFPGLGLHIGQDDIPVPQARAALGTGRVLGLSTHSPEQAAGAIAQAHLLDYFAVGPVFATQTKPDYIPVGLDLVRHVAGLRPPLPWVCIGGINADNAQQVIDAGAQGLVAVSDVLLAEDTASAVARYCALFG